MENSNYLSLKQFQRTTGISDKALVALLSNNHLPAILEEGKLMINMQDISTEHLIEASKTAQKHTLEPYRQLFIDRFAELLQESLDDLLTVALEEIPSGSSSTSS
jgi:hypothetical protein